VQALAADLWGDIDGLSVSRHSYGKGKVIWGVPLAEVLASMHVAKDFDYSRALDAICRGFIATAGDADIYFVANRTDVAQDVEARSA